MVTTRERRRQVGRTPVPTIIIFALAVLLLGLNHSVAGVNFGFNRKQNDTEKRERRRQLLEQRNAAVDDDWHAEASTGTVRNIKSPEDKAEPVCNREMAKSLVQANEGMQKAKDEKIVAVNKYEQALKDIESLQSFQSNLEGKVANLEDKLDTQRRMAAERETEIENIAEQRVAAAQAKADDKVARVEAAMAQLTAETEQKIANVNTERDEAVAVIRQSMEKLAAEKDDEISSVKQKMADEAAGLQNEFNQKVAALEKERDGVVEDVMNKKHLSERAVLGKLEAANAKHAADIEAVKAEGAKGIKSLKEKLSELERELKESNKKEKEAEDKYNKAMKELDHWEGVFSQRSYCNLTHIGEDAAFMAWVASMQASEKLNVAASQASVAAKRLQEKTLKSAEPHIKTANKMYESLSAEGNRLYAKYLKKHVDAVTPHYNSYAAPVVDKASKLGKEYHAKAMAEAGRQSTQMATGGDRMARKLFNNLVSQFGTECPKTLFSMKAFAKEHELNVPGVVVDAWSRSCKHPRETVATALKVLAFIFVILFRRRIFRLISWCILLPLVIMSYIIAPLRWLFGRRKTNEAQPTQNGVSKKDGMPSNGTTSSNGQGIRVKKRAVRVSQ